MKKLLTITFSIILGCQISKAQWTEKTIDMKPGFGDQVFYSMENGEVGRSSVYNWDIAYTTYARDNGILLNHINGWELYAYPKSDTSGWGSFDTAGWMAFQKLFNPEDTLHEGAFNISTNPSDPWDFSWGRYNLTTHTVIGDSLYLLVRRDQTQKIVDFKKFWVVKQTSTNGNVTIRMANLDGSNDQTKEIANAGADYVYTYFSFNNMQTVTREPKKTNWDISFTRYFQYLGPHSPISHYPSTGVITNENTVVKEIRMTDPDDIELWQMETLSGLKVNHYEVGADWKYNDRQTHQTYLVDSLTYLVKKDSTSKEVHAFYFSSYEGSTTGILKINQKASFNTSLETSDYKPLELYPNPAKDLATVLFDKEMSGQATVMNSLGSIVYQTDFSKTSNLSINLSDLSKGHYFVRISSKSNLYRAKLLVE